MTQIPPDLGGSSARCPTRRLLRALRGASRNVSEIAGNRGRRPSATLNRQFGELRGPPPRGVFLARSFFGANHAPRVFETLAAVGCLIAVVFPAELRSTIHGPFIVRWPPHARGGGKGLSQRAAGASAAQVSPQDADSRQPGRPLWLDRAEVRGPMPDSPAGMQSSAGVIASTSGESLRPSPARQPESRRRDRCAIAHACFRERAMRRRWRSTSSTLTRTTSPTETTSLGVWTYSLASSEMWISPS